MITTLITVVSWIIAGFVSYDLYKKFYTKSVKKHSEEGISYIIFLILFVSVLLSAFVIIRTSKEDNWNFIAMIISFCLTCAGPIVIGLFTKSLVQKKIMSGI